MASSGWQTEQTLTSWGSYGAHLGGNVRIDSIVHSGTTVTVSGAVRCALRTNSGAASTWSNSVSGYVTGGSTVSFGGPFSGTKTSPDVRDRSFTATLSAAASATTVTLSVRFAGGSLNTTKSWTLSIPIGGTAPAVPTISITSITDTGATFAVAVSNYGDPSSDPNRGLHASIFDINTFLMRSDSAIAVSSADITVGNTDIGALQITPNTIYHYYAEADNTVLQTPSHSPIASTPTFLTLPAYISDVVVADDGAGNLTISVVHAEEGNDDVAYTEYSYDQINWNAVRDEFHIVAHSDTTIYIRRENSAGTTPVYVLNISPISTVALYGSVDGETKKIIGLYGSVDGQSKKVARLYGSVSGVSKMIYEDYNGTN